MSESPDELEDCFWQVYRMALAAWQSQTFWLHTRVEGSPNEDIIKRYGHFFYASHEAHLTMMVISLDCLFDVNALHLQNFQSLLVILEPKVSKAHFEVLSFHVVDLQKRAKGLSIIRNNSFAHITRRNKRIPAGEKHEPNLGEIMSLCYAAIKLATDIGTLLGLDMVPVQTIFDEDLKSIRELYENLSCVA